jgi:hypothetical protein
MGEDVGSGDGVYAGGGPFIEAGRLGNKSSSRREDTGDVGIYEEWEGTEVPAECADA